MSAVCKIAMLLLAGLSIVNQFVPGNQMTVSFVAAIVVLVSGIWIMGSGFKKVTIGFLFIGISLMVYFGQPFSVWVTGINYLTNVISILVIMQLFSVPIEVGKYDEAVRYWLTKSFKKEPGLFLFATLTTHIFSSFLLFGTIPVMVSLLGQTLKLSVSNYERFISAAISRGYALAVLWAPGAINLLLVVQATEVGWTELFFPGLILSLIGIVTSWIIETKLVLTAKPILGDAFGAGVNQNQAVAARKAGHIILVVVGLVLITVLFDKLNVGASTGRVMLAGIIIVLVWSTACLKQPDFKANILNYWRSGLLKAGDLAPLFIAMGLLATAVEKSGLLALVQPGLQELTNTMGVLAIIVLPVLMILGAVLGIHPFISIVLFGHVFTALALPVAPVSLALCLALGGSISYIVSPFAGIVLTLAKFIKCRTVDIALRWNWIYSLVFFVEGIAFSYFWGLFFG
ncbi:MAG: hypothetical protein H6Q73_142 [Firmicutes bacterium]|nr:hypothetical protein [Bacillota bacterium]